MILGERVRLRPVERGDLEHFVEWFSDPEVRRFLDMHLPLSLAQEKRWFEQLLDQMEKQQVVMLTIETNEGVCIGNVSLFNINWKDRSAELGITIGDKDHWDEGYGSDAVNAMVGLAFRNMNLNRVCLRVHADNVRGIRCYEKAGFRQEGVLRESVFREGIYQDMHMMSILASEYRDDG